MSADAESEMMQFRNCARRNGTASAITVLRPSARDAELETMHSRDCFVE